MKLVFRNIWRNRKISLIATLTVAVSAFFLMVFSDNIAAYEKKLDESCASLKVTAHIMGNNATATPQLTEEQYRAILGTGFIAEHSVMKDQTFGDNDVMRGINSPDIDVTLKVCVDNIVWAEGYDESVFTSSEWVCVAPANAWLEPGATVGLLDRRPTCYADHCRCLRKQVCQPKQRNGVLLSY